MICCLLVACDFSHFSDTMSLRIDTDETYFFAFFVNAVVILKISSKAQYITTLVISSVCSSTVMQPVIGRQYFLYILITSTLWLTTTALVVITVNSCSSCHKFATINVAVMYINYTFYFRNVWQQKCISVCNIRTQWAKVTRCNLQLKVTCIISTIQFCK